ncbi:hypothetical protein CcarbDRAFT_1922 [Clostridium carboxidivorans P7]|uniref:Uncharacterized protein n=1 Tax=Clostridium carboxidivorans P7 TaxID=536227 RepID=C6PT05_9CLOT|nr:hypothetical protein [Clostridium carboxidivorans]EET87640.1 hypothetical protein CcarbDRAFT_1922 [Clostridium carboxidivorans P7]
MKENGTLINKICTNCIHVKVNPKSKYKNPDLHCTRRGNCKLTNKEEAKWCSLYKEGE